ncbi:hypothetical protein J2Y02_000577 [Neobacillus drentensis]|nr:hypothetical protein [Neobacillus drentensis]
MYSLYCFLKRRYERKDFCISNILVQLPGTRVKEDVKVF